MTRHILTILILIFFVSCKQADQCDFNSYVKSLSDLKPNFVFKTSADIPIPSKSNSCDSVYFGANVTAVGIIGRQQNFFLILLVNKKINDNIYLATIDTTGKLVDKYELGQFNGIINDSLKQWTTYELRSKGLLLRIDTCELPMYIGKVEKCFVRTAWIDTFMYSNGRITK